MHLSEQGWKALFALEISETCHTNQLSLFDCNIGDVVNYASEIRGTNKCQNCCVFRGLYKTREVSIIYI